MSTAEIKESDKGEESISGDDATADGTEETADGDDATERELSLFADLFVLVSRCFEPPHEQFHEALKTGAFETRLTGLANDLDIEVEPMPEPKDLSELRRSYRLSFEAYRGPYAPLAESVYEKWWDGTHRELLSGPAAHDMRSRYEAIDAEVPAEYPPDHVSLILEYASLVLETEAPRSERIAAFEKFADEHFDWLPEFQARVEETSEEQFYRWATTLLVQVCERARSLGID